jgi:hypothetical protein
VCGRQISNLAAKVLFPWYTYLFFQFLNGIGLIKSVKPSKLGSKMSESKWKRGWMWRESPLLA